LTRVDHGPVINSAEVAGQRRRGERAGGAGVGAY
jgi:hypothetical protein